ncbi:hypothetical protein A5906_04845 [Bradyrhizobium sacchari]|uniref:Uncharacterized protein n=1 Tax=Bradyrhizobium sacchari TaxID=1399419 RepID=A0A560KMT4_9BRAD|nr:hypothetical protein [Bradyrhizobium sacchari]OPY96571.1 hypothetical protein A5906_04845 [Bradyrhizobium sacchari]TWB67356.1 hypothetical protein FBZ94_1011038 [Bradyrhizobium sacchari]TWB84593.1 hypothetical protein FBZ95_1011038 [Bradyrhizobium sacchari]
MIQSRVDATITAEKAVVDVYVHPAISSLDPMIKDVLESLTAIRFKDCQNLFERRPGDVVLSLSGDERVAEELWKRQVRHFHAMPYRVERGATGNSSKVVFTGSRQLKPLLRNRALQHAAFSNVPVLRDPGGEVLAYFDRRPVWVETRKDGCVGQMASIPLPALRPGEQPLDYLNGSNFMQLLPLLQFLVKETEEIGWRHAPLRACFTLDDPNLRLPSYGFLNYRELVEQAQKHHFHVALAMIPVDVWSTHSNTVSLIKRSSRYVSLLIHGNNHTRAELSRSRPRERTLAILGQSLSRIEWLEKTTALRVDRVMVPPHNALSDKIAPLLLASGFEGAAVAMTDLRDRNPEMVNRPTFGLRMAEMTSGGFPVLGRIELSAACEGDVVISAMLGAPIIFGGHHECAAGGLDLFSDCAATVNSLGDVQWCSLETILRSNYLSRQENSRLWIQPYSCRLELRVPEGVSSMMIIGPDLQKAGAFRLIRKSEVVPGRRSVLVHANTPFDVVPGEAVELISSNLGTIDHRHIKMARPSAWALVRRFLCEARDRGRAFLPVARAARKPREMPIAPEKT